MCKVCSVVYDMTATTINNKGTGLASSRRELIYGFGHNNVASTWTMWSKTSKIHLIAAPQTKINMNTIIKLVINVGIRVFISSIIITMINFSDVLFQDDVDNHMTHDLRTAGEHGIMTKQITNMDISKLSEVLVSGFHYCWESTTLLILF